MLGQSFPFDMAHMLAGGMVTVSFMLLFQDRLIALIWFLALHALALALALAWQAHRQAADDLYVAAALALVVKAILIPMGLRWLVRHLQIERTVEAVVGVGMAMLFGIGLVALSVMVMLPAATHSPLMWEDLSFALAVVMLGLLIMITRRNAMAQIIGLLSVDNGVTLAVVGIRGMPLVIDLGVACLLVAAMVVFAIYFKHIHQRFDSVDVHVLDRFRGEES
jgi:hydrogenase-4 component E